MPKCPNCNKKLLWNYMKRRFECPKQKLGKKGVMENYGCGYVNAQQFLGVNETTDSSKGRY